MHDLRHSHASWLIAAKVPLPAIQGRLGHESITTTVDRYGHLLDALDDEVMAAVEWAMDPTAPLPGFLEHSGLAAATDGLPHVPRQLSGLAQETWKDASDMTQDDAEHRSDLVFVVTLGGREVPFADREHAQDVADQWNDDHADEIETMRSDGWPEEKIARHGGVGPEERERWTGPGPVWTRMPERQFVHYAVAQRAVAIREVQALGGTIAECTDRLLHAQAHIQELEQRLAEKGRFGRPVLRGEDRAAVEAARDGLLRTREEGTRELEQMSMRLYEVTQQAGPLSEQEAVLTEVDMPQEKKALLLRRAQEKDNQAARQNRAEAAKARNTSNGAAYRVAGLRNELSARAEGKPPTSGDEPRHQHGRDRAPVSPYFGQADVHVYQPHDGPNEPPVGPLV
nr:tyrosine-type recombinase/integrase [Streptomyces sp. S063]